MQAESKKLQRLEQNECDREQKKIQKITKPKIGSLKRSKINKSDKSLSRWAKKKRRFKLLKSGMKEETFLLSLRN